MLIIGVVVSGGEGRVQQAIRVENRKLLLCGKAECQTEGTGSHAQ